MIPAVKSGTSVVENTSWTEQGFIKFYCVPQLVDAGKTWRCTKEDDKENVYFLTDPRAFLNSYGWVFSSFKARLSRSDFTCENHFNLRK